MKRYWERAIGKQAKGSRLLLPLHCTDTLGHISPISLRFPLQHVIRTERQRWLKTGFQEGRGRIMHKGEGFKAEPCPLMSVPASSAAAFSMQDFVLNFLLTVSSSPGKTNSNNPRINRIIHLFLILISDDVIFILTYYPARGSLWKPETPLK